MREDGLVARPKRRFRGTTDSNPSPSTASNRLIELTKIRAEVAERRALEVGCLTCRKASRAERPSEISCSSFGPRWAAMGATLISRFRLSRRDLEDLWIWTATNRHVTHFHPGRSRSRRDLHRLSGPEHSSGRDERSEGIVIDATVTAREPVVEFSAATDAAGAADSASAAGPAVPPDAPRARPSRPGPWRSPGIPRGYFSMYFAIVWSCTFVVPSWIVPIFESRQSFSTGCSVARAGPSPSDRRLVGSVGSDVTISADPLPCEGSHGAAAAMADRQRSRPPHFLPVASARPISFPS
jgi:hypothetical protein